MKISFGRYLPLNSIIHKVDPRIKLVVLICLIIAIFFPTGFSGFAVLGIVVLLIFLLAKLPVSMLFRLLRPMLFMFFILFIINCALLNKPIGDIKIDEDKLGWYKQWKFFVISSKSIFMSLYMGVRIYLMIIVTTILTTTTQPLDLTFL